MSSVFFNREDVIKNYCKRRKNLPEEDVDDLMNCIFGYLKQITKDDDVYAIRIGRLGFMYKKFDKEYYKKHYPNKKNNTLNKMFVELALNDKVKISPIIAKDILDKEYKGMSIEEIQDIQNVYED